MNLKRILILWILCGLLAGPANAMDSSAGFLLKLFMDVCVPNMGRPENVKAWADRQRLQVIANPTALELFVGLGSKGIAWAIPSNVGSFALSIRGRTQGCAVWARNANPSDVETGYKKILEGVKRPGLEVIIDKDSIDPSPVGQVRSLVYQVRAVSGSIGYEFVMLAAQNPGGAFQASIQVHPVKID
jgi:hypothetical protein